MSGVAKNVESEIKKSMILQKYRRNLTWGAGVTYYHTFWGYELVARAVIDSKLFTTEVIEEIQRILKHGNSAELKQENNRLVVVEIQRKVKIKISAKR